MNLPPAPIRAFLDANVLYSAAIGGRVESLWQLRGVVLVSSEYAILEASENLRADVREGAQHQATTQRLAELVERVEVFIPSPGRTSQPSWSLPDPDDVPILAAAIESGCGVLLTGDKRAFGAFFDKEVEGVRVLRPGVFVQQHLRALGSD